MREISIIKERILKYLDFKGVSKYKFYQETGITNGILSQSNGISEENLLKFLSQYKDISADWLLTGEGEMLRGGNVQVSGSGNAVVGNSHNSTATVNATPTDTSDLRAMVEEQRTIIEGLQGQLQEKDRQIAQLLAIISKK